jgi:hypothetical protein
VLPWIGFFCDRRGINDANFKKANQLIDTYNKELSALKSVMAWKTILISLVMNKSQVESRITEAGHEAHVKRRLVYGIISCGPPPARQTLILK